jgi:hypothetical protein
MNRFFVLLFILPFFFAAACGNDEKRNMKDIDPESIYFDYKVWGEEGFDNITVKLQYRIRSENGESILLEDPAKVELDGEVLKADSARMTGVYYEVQKPVKTFSGKHTITFIDIKNKKYRESFNFQPVTLAKPVPSTLQRSDLIFEFNGLSPEDLVRVLITDTSFLSDEINRIDSVKNGRIIITKEELMALSNGPVHMQIIKEYEREIKSGTSRGGRLSISYGLRREFILEE